MFSCPVAVCPARPCPCGSGHSPCPHPRPPGAESLSPVSHLHRLPPFMLSLPWTRPTAPCRGPARAARAGRDGTDGELRGSDVYRRTRAAGAAEGMGDISDQEAERLPRGWGCRVPTVRNEPSTDVGQTRPWSLARGRVLPKPLLTPPERPPRLRAHLTDWFPTAAVMSQLNPAARNHTFVLRFGKQNGLRK